MLRRRDTIREMRDEFRWQVPERFNIGRAICDDPAARDPEALAIIDAPEGGEERHWSRAGLKRLADRVGLALAGRIGIGDRVGVLLPQRVETAAAHIAILRAGAISLPLFKLFGAEALRHRLADSGARVVITDREGAQVLAGLRAGLPALELVLSVEDGGDARLADLGTDMPPPIVPVETHAADPAILIYTSGTTGPPKGALLPHATLLGHLPGVEMSHDFLPQPGDRLWTPADWAWIGGLIDVMMPALFHGVPLVACRFRKFTAGAAFDLMARHGVRNAFLPPTALKIMAQMPEPPRLPMRSVASGGETLGAGLLDWGRRVFGCTINEFYGQTECNMIVSSCASVAPSVPGVMGFAVPGHDVAVLGADGQFCAPGEEGEIVVRAPDPVMFLRYWQRPEATAEKFVEVDGTRWLRTGDRGAKTPEGRFRYIGRDDDVISSAGYRIGPGEIEDCLGQHEAVAMAGVVGRPDPVKGEAIVAFVVPVAGVAAGPDLAEALRRHVAETLARHEVPREIVFVDALPMTTTGKIMRRVLRDRAAREDGERYED